MREIIRSCYSYHGLDPSTYIQPDLEDPNERIPIPRDLQVSPKQNAAKEQRKRNASASNLHLAGAKKQATIQPQQPDGSEQVSKDLESLHRSEEDTEERREHIPQEYTPLAVRKPKRQKNQPQKFK